MLHTLCVNEYYIEGYAGRHCIAIGIQAVPSQAGIQYRRYIIKLENQDAIPRIGSILTIQIQVNDHFDLADPVYGYRKT